MNNRPQSRFKEDKMTDFIPIDWAADDLVAFGVPVKCDGVPDGDGEYWIGRRVGSGNAYVTSLGRVSGFPEGPQVVFNRSRMPAAQPTVDPVRAQMAATIYAGYLAQGGDWHSDAEVVAATDNLLAALAKGGGK